ncbi:MAG TPA: type IV toxin-antitoxin system AbiEi family antitoxin [Steroidobacteraceae bacterium]|nr:type IV toxin-antitoxin system AbiEi family antitoxin [Steroidobacteraceae bacterium]
MANWLDTYFGLRRQPYYVGLLSAAALHGSSQQAPQVTQVLATKPMRPMEVGRLRIEFHVKSSVTQTPLALLPGLPAPLAVSTPEATALDLIAFSHRIGGIRRALEVIAGFRSVMTLAGLKEALSAEPQTAVKQRFGYVLALLGLDRLAAEVHKGLSERLAAVTLQTHSEFKYPKTTVSQPWMVLDNVGLGRGEK